MTSRRGEGKAVLDPHWRFLISHNVRTVLAGPAAVKIWQEQVDAKYNQYNMSQTNKRATMPLRKSKCIITKRTVRVREKLQLMEKLSNRQNQRGGDVNILDKQ